MTYVDGFVFVVPKKNLEAYRKMATLGRDVWKEHGALDYKECMLNDPKVEGLMPFTELTKAKKDELVFFSFIVFSSKKHRDEVNAKVMQDKRMTEMGTTMKEMPFDMKKMAYGGFETVVEK